jgi:hypothetical protein
MSEPDAETIDREQFKVNEYEILVRAPFLLLFLQR